MRAAAAVVVAAVGCAQTFDNPFDPDGGSWPLPVKAKQVGIDAVEITWPPLVHPGAGAVRLLRQDDLGVTAVAGEAAPGAGAFVDHVEPGGKYLWRAVAVGLDGTVSRASPAAELDVLPTQAIVPVITFPDFDRVRVGWSDPHLDWVPRVRVELAEEGGATKAATEAAAAGEHVFPVEPGHTYRIRLQLVLPDGAEGPDRTRSTSEPFDMHDGRTRGVSLVRPVWSPERIVVRWTPVPHAARYALYVAVGAASQDPGTATQRGPESWRAIDGGARLETDLIVPDGAVAYTVRVAASSVSGLEGPRSEPVTSNAPGWRKQLDEPRVAVLPDWEPRGASFDRAANAVYAAYSDDTTHEVRIFRLGLAPFTGLELVAQATLPRRLETGGVWARAQGRLWVVPFGRDPSAPSESPHLAIALDGSSTPAFPLVVASGVTPAVRTKHALAFDPGLKTVWIHGGQEASNGALLGDFWRLDLDTALSAGWKKALASPGIPATSRHALGADDDGGAFVYAPTTAPGGTTTYALRAGQAAFEAAAAPSQGTSPSPPVFDAASLTLVETTQGRRRLLVGGRSSAGVATRAVWAFDESAATWSELHPAGDGPPPGTCSAVSIGSTVEPQLLVFGRGGLWRLRIAATPAWTRLDAPPVGRSAAAFTVDEAGRSWVWGGQGGSGAMSDLHSVDTARLAPWVTEPQASAPAARAWAAMTVDWTAVGRPLLLAGGLPASPDRKIWRFGPTRTWTALSTSTPPPFLSKHALAVSRLGSAAGGPGVLVGIGGDGSAATSGDVVTVALSSGETRVATSGNGPPAPPTRKCALPVASCLEQQGRFGVVVVEGAGSGGHTRAWRLELGSSSPAWTPTREDGPHGCVEALACAKTANDEAAYALVTEDGVPELWRLTFPASGVQWRKLALAGRTPGVRVGPALGWEAATNALVLAFGLDDLAQAHGDLWRLPLE